MTVNEDRNRRGADRTRIAIFVTLRVGGEEHTCRATDLSAGGIRVECSGTPIAEVGQTVAVSFEIPDTDRTIETSGEVVHASGQSVGVAFARLQKSARKAIEVFVEENGPFT